MKDQLFIWYQKEGRTLPWRENPHPYHVFLSEIILQQTRVEQGMPYFHRFIENFPQIQNLSTATEEEVLKLWQGLGYYSRARNLWKAAKYLVEHHGGVFPSTYDELIKIPGIGPYTARAMMAFAFSKPEVAADGNIWRVTSRYFGLKEEFPNSKSIALTQELWKDWVVENPSHFNNAMMDIGARICTPLHPSCDICPLNGQCFSFSEKSWSNFPVKTKKTKATPLTLLYFISKKDDRVLMKKRDETSIWANLYDFPELNFPIHFSQKDEENLIYEELRKYQRIKKVISIQKQPIHLLSHRKIQPFFCFVEFVPILQLEKGETWIQIKNIHQLPVPKLIESLIATF